MARSLGAATGLLAGGLAPLRGAVLLVRHRALWGWAAVPIALGLALTGLVIAGELLPSGEGEGLRGWLETALHWAVLSGIIVMQILIALTAPVLDLLGETAEERLGFRTPGPSFLAMVWRPSFWLRIARSLLEAVKLLLFKGLLWLLAAPLSLIPWVGPPLAFLVGGIATGVDFVDYPLARRDWTLRAKLRWARAHRWAVLGFGLATFGLLAVPALAGLMLAPAVVGGTEMVFRLEGADSGVNPRSPAHGAPARSP